jgi:hypothetical protein
MKFASRGNARAFVLVHKNEWTGDATASSSCPGHDQELRGMAGSASHENVALFPFSFHDYWSLGGAVSELPPTKQYNGPRQNRREKTAGYCASVQISQTCAYKLLPNWN